MFSDTQKIGILGGGQLGKMLCLAAADWDFKTYITRLAASQKTSPRAAKAIRGEHINL